MFSSPLDKITRGLLRHLSRRCPGFSSEPFLQTLPPSHTSPIALGVCRTYYWCKENLRLWNEGKKRLLWVYSITLPITVNLSVFLYLGVLFLVQGPFYNWELWIADGNTNPNMNRPHFKPCFPPALSMVKPGFCPFMNRFQHSLTLYVFNL